MNKATYSQLPSAELLQIVRAVHQHDFYITDYHNLVKFDVTHQVLIDTVKEMAASSNLKVSFNHEMGLCIFERDI